eukprot:1160445-Pelagomonas_calceolata.AAC.10
MDALKSHVHAKHRQIAKQATTLITRACYLMQVRALALPSGTCQVSDTHCVSTRMKRTINQTKQTKRYTSLVCPLPECPIIWIAPSKFSQVANAPSFLTR